MTGAWLWILPLGPILIGAFMLLTGHRLDRSAGAIAVATCAAALGLAITAWAVRPEVALSWIPAGADSLPLRLSTDAAAAPLAFLVAAISFLVMIYALENMAQDPARARFFGFMTFFCGAMELLVLAHDLLTILIAFELVGLSSYALIGFWYAESERVKGANRAFLTTRFTDLGLYGAAFAAFAGGRDLGFDSLPALAPPYAAFAAAGLILAAAGKSAQLPFSGWLSGAMLGPSPVSALLHSATMVAAGAVLLIKALPLLESVGWALPLVLWLGVVTALAGGAVALVQTDFKQLLAASTLSQFGYIFAGIGAAGSAAALSHLVNHAAFKASLFMVAGALLHQGLRRLGEMGGLRRRMPVSAIIFGAAALALAALPPMGGFLSKDALLARIKETEPIAFWIMIGISALTATYAARACLRAFGGEARSDEAKAAREPAMPIVAPAAILTLGAFLAVAFLMPPLKTWWTAALGAGPLPPFSVPDAAIAMVAALFGLASAFVLQRWLPVAAGDHWAGLVGALDAVGAGMLWVGRSLDRLEQLHPATAIGRGGVIFARHLEGPDPIQSLGRGGLDFAHVLGRFDAGAFSRFSMTSIGRRTASLARLSHWVDRSLWDGLIMQLNRLLQAAAQMLSSLQSGLLHRYYAATCAGIGFLLLYAVLLNGS